MFTSEEIRQITFEKAMRGYRQEDVESFIDKIADQIDIMEKDKKDLEEKLYVLAEKIEQYKLDEESIKTSLISSHRLGESIIADAKEKAENIVREATIKKNDIISSAYAEIEGSEEELKKLKKEVSDFKRTVLGLYKEHIESLSQLPEEKTEEAVEELAIEAVEETPAETPVVEAVVELDSKEETFKSVSSLFDEE